MIWNLCLWFSFSVITNLSKQNQKFKVIFERIEINCVNYRNWHISKVLSLVRWFKKRQCHHENIARSSSLQYTQIENWIAVDDYLWKEFWQLLRRYTLLISMIDIKQFFQRRHLGKTNNSHSYQRRFLHHLLHKLFQKYPRFD